MSMNVPILNQMTVIRMLCVPTLKVPTCVIVSKDTLETASVVQVLLSIQIHTVVVKTQQTLRILFEKEWKIQYEQLMSLLEMFVVISCFFPTFLYLVQRKIALWSSVWRKQSLRELCWCPWVCLQRRIHWGGQLQRYHSKNAFFM